MNEISELELRDFLDDELFLFVSDGYTPTNNFIDGSPSHSEFKEKELDEIFTNAFEEFDSYSTEEQESGVNFGKADSSMVVTDTRQASRQAPRIFGKPVSNEDITRAMQKAVPEKTQKDNKYCVGLWEEWVSCRAKTTPGVVVPHLNKITAQELQHWLCAFVLEIRKKDGNPFPPNTIHHVCCGIMRYLRINGMPEIDFFRNEGFSRFRQVLDSEMKRLQVAGIGTMQRKAEPITFEEEEILWQKGILGGSTPQSLLDTMLYMNGLYFALRGGKEHRNLRHKPSQIQLVEKPGETPYLMYIEDLSKNHPGGLKGRKIKRKVVYHHANTQKPERCFVQLYKLYNTRCPINRPDHAYYLKPLQMPQTDHCWYTNQPVGHCTLSNTIKRLCNEAGIPGYRTNHSLRATAATRLHQSGCVEEQEIMERTGHRSIEAVRSYKRASREQLEQVSDILNNENSQKKPCPNNTLQLVQSKSLSQSVSNSLSVEYTAPGTVPVFNISSCPSVIINNYSNK